MPKASHDRFLAHVLQQERTAFGFAAHSDYGWDLPGELVWVMVSALMRAEPLTLNQAARVVLDFIERRSADIPGLLRGDRVTDIFKAEDQPDKKYRSYRH